LYSEDSLEDSLFYYLWFTAETNFTHSGVTLFREHMLYKVIAYIDLSREEIQYLISLNDSIDRIRRSNYGTCICNNHNNWSCK